MNANEFADIIVELEKRGFVKRKLKTLTDDEMELAYYECFDLKNKMPDNEKRRSYFKFARAILRKAQEK